MKDRFFDILARKKFLICDGAMGTMLLNYDYTGNCPEKLNLDNPALIKKIHTEYFFSGADIIETNTFGASPLKLAQFGLQDRTEELNSAAVKIAREVVGRDGLVAGDIGPLGKLLEPMGNTSFDNAYDAFARQAKALEKGGADVLIIETMSDIQEMRAALIAAKQETRLPVICSFTYDKNGRTLTGTDFITAALTCQALGADVISTNCGNGPAELYAMLSGLEKDLPRIHVPLMIMPNAGLPVLEEGKAVYLMSPEEFGMLTSKFTGLGFSIFGGCCGTTPAHIKKLKESLALSQSSAKDSLTPSLPRGSARGRAGVGVGTFYFTSRQKYIEVSDKSPLLIIGERLNPTARKAFSAELKEGRVDFLKQEALKQQEEGAQLLDLNVGVPELDQRAAMKKMSAILQNVCLLPICFDSDDPAVLEEALKNYPGIALVNSVNGKERVLNSVLPLVKKYGASVIALALDEQGIPQTVKGRMYIVKKILRAAKRHGLDPSRLFVDALVMAVATDPEAPAITLETIKACNKLGLKTSLGVSNVSFGLPQRTVINNAFLTLAEKAGLTAAIVNPATVRIFTKDTQGFRLAKAVLLGKDRNAKVYIAAMNKKASAITPAPKKARGTAAPVSERLYHAVIEGAEDQVLLLAEEALRSETPEKILGSLIRGIEQVGELYQKGEYFLPQMVASANTMKKAFERVKQAMPAGSMASAGTVVICTVQGDIHDIGKNIVAMMLENHGFRVIDLGKDVPRDDIVTAARREKADIVCLSALLTTTMPEMYEVKKALEKAGIPAKVMVGGAVVTAGFAAKLQASYSKDAVGAVQTAKEIVHGQKN